MKVLVLDNYDSFTYNLVQLLRESKLTTQLDVFRNNKISLEAVAEYDKILLSPGPSLPKNAGIMPALIKEYAATKSIFGVCLGHQAIAESFGAQLFNLSEVMHGVATPIYQTAHADYVFDRVPAVFKACRYHSWAVALHNLPEQLQSIAIDDQGVMMALRHVRYDVRGVQFHPESVLSPEGKKMIENWLRN